MKIGIKTHNRIWDEDEIDFDHPLTHFTPEEYKKYPDIDLYDVKVSTSQKGFLGIRFHSRNHKYFDISHHPSWSSWDDLVVEDEEEKEGTTISIHLECEELMLKENTYPSCVSSAEIQLVGETEQEKRYLEDTYVVSFPLKWEYVLLLLPYDTILFDELFDGENLFDLKEDVVERFDSLPLRIH